MRSRISENVIKMELNVEKHLKELKKLDLTRYYSLQYKVKITESENTRNCFDCEKRENRIASHGRLIIPDIKFFDCCQY